MFKIILMVNDEIVAIERVVNVSERHGLTYGTGEQVYENLDYDDDDEIHHVAKSGVRGLAVKVLYSAINHKRK